MQIGMIAGLAGTVVKGIAGIAGAQGGAAQAKIRERAGRVKAEQVDAAYRAELNTAISNIRGIRAASGNSNSPTERAVIDRQEKISDRNRRIKKASIQLQADQDALDAKLHKASMIGVFGDSILRLGQLDFG